MVIESAALVVGDDQERLVPAWSAADSAVDGLDQLLAQRDVVVGMLAVSRRPPARLEERVLGQRPGCGVGLEVGEEPEAGIWRGRRVRVVLAGQRLFVVAVNLPAQAVCGHQPEDALDGVGGCAIVHVPLARGGAGEGPVRNVSVGTELHQ